MQDFVNTSEGFDFSTTSHTATLCYDTANTTDRCIINTIPTSSCSEGVCQFEFDDLQSLSHGNSSAVVAVRAYSSNIIGNGLKSGPIVVGMFIKPVRHLDLYVLYNSTHNGIFVSQYCALNHTIGIGFYV